MLSEKLCIPIQDGFKNLQNFDSATFCHPLKQVPVQEVKLSSYQWQFLGEYEVSELCSHGGEHVWSTDIAVNIEEQLAIHIRPFSHNVIFTIPAFQLHQVLYA